MGGSPPNRDGASRERWARSPRSVLDSYRSGTYEHDRDNDRGPVGASEAPGEREASTREGVADRGARERHSMCGVKEVGLGTSQVVERRYEKTVGTTLVALGVAILLFGFYQAYTLSQNLPSSASNSKGPTAAFSWTVNGFSVTFTDTSSPGSSAISSSYWNFGDGNTTYANNTAHLYTRSGIFNASLEVQDSSGAVSESNGLVHVGPGSTGGGQGSPSVSPSSILGSLLNFNLGSDVTGFLKVIETFAVIILVWLIGASILKAGWNLITPKSETIQVRVKPRSLQVEPVEPASSRASVSPTDSAGLSATVSGTPPTPPTPPS